jgi:hypothetical protein
MLFNNEIKSRCKSTLAERPPVTSYDSCHEHSIEHCIELRILVEESARETIVIGEPEKAIAAFA